MKHMNPNFYFKILDSQQLIFLASNMKQICWQNTPGLLFFQKKKILKRQKYYFQAPSPKYYYETTNIVGKYHKP